MNYKDDITRHIHSLGGKTSQESKYEYINTTDDMLSAMMRAHKDLQYPLLKESKRDRFLIANSEGLEKLIREILSEEMNQATNEIADLISYDMAIMVQQRVNGMLTGKKAIIKPSNYSQKISQLIGRAIGSAVKRLVQALISGK